MLIRFSLSIPLIIAILYTISAWNEPHLQLSVYFTFVVGICVAFLISRARLPESFSNQKPRTTSRYMQEAREHRDVFMIPGSCSICKTPLRLDLVEWKDQNTLLCQECHSKISVTVS
jgi:hypothetical protein